MGPNQQHHNDSFDEPSQRGALSCPCGSPFVIGQPPQIRKPERDRKLEMAISGRDATKEKPACRPVSRQARKRCDQHGFNVKNIKQTWILWRICQEISQSSFYKKLGYTTTKRKNKTKQKKKKKKNMGQVLRMTFCRQSQELLAEIMYANALPSIN